MIANIFEFLFKILCTLYLDNGLHEDEKSMLVVISKMEENTICKKHEYEKG